jgi:hypothetical protein
MVPSPNVDAFKHFLESVMRRRRRKEDEYRRHNLYLQVAHIAKLFELGAEKSTYDVSVTYFRHHIYI